MTQFANNLRSRAKALGLSNAEVARRVGVSERRYGNYVAGTREPDLATLSRIARALVSSVDDLLAATEQDASAGALERLTSAAGGLSQADLETMAIQVEALAKHRASQ